MLPLQWFPDLRQGRQPSPFPQRVRFRYDPAVVSGEGVENSVDESRRRRVVIFLGKFHNLVDDGTRGRFGIQNLIHSQPQETACHTCHTGNLPFYSVFLNLAVDGGKILRRACEGIADVVGIGDLRVLLVGVVKVERFFIFMKFPREQKHKYNASAFVSG